MRGIFDAADETKVTNIMMFHWDYLNETLRKIAPGRASQVGAYIIGIDNPDNAAAVSLAVDAVFKNSLAETLTETEQAFQLSFVAMSNQIIAAIRIVSYVVILIIMAVMANTMAMSGARAHRRICDAEGARQPLFLRLLIYGEALAIAGLGGILGIALTFRWPMPSARPWVPLFLAVFYRFGFDGRYAGGPCAAGGYRFSGLSGAERARVIVVRMACGAWPRLQVPDFILFAPSGIAGLTTVLITVAWRWSFSFLPPC
ncbi:MAG: hypothetical protein IPP85_18895 [Propionivibrio sp.]|nr:hypothetical protein [Propionivibrio sp.]